MAAHLFFFLLLPLAPATGQPEASTAEALALFRSGRLDDSISLYRKVLEATPRSGSANLGLVDALIWNGKVAEAEEQAKAFHSQYPDNAEGLVALGDVHYRMARFHSASAAYRDAIDRDSDQALAHLGLGRVLETESRLQDAARHYDQAWALDPSHPEIVAARAAILPYSPEELELWKRYEAMAGYLSPEEQGSLRNRIALRRHFPGQAWSRLVTPRDSEIELKKLASGGSPQGWTVKVRLNGGKEHSLIVDTASSGIWLEKEFLRKEGLPLLTELAGNESGSSQLDKRMALAKDFQIGGVVFRDVIVGAVDTKLEGADGLLGTGMLWQFLVRLDLAEGRMQLKPLPGVPARWDYSWNRTIGPDRREFTKARTLAGVLLVQTVLNNEEPSYFIVDTGFPLNMISERLSKRFTLTRHSTLKLQGVTGKAYRTMQGEAIVLEFGNFVQVNQNIYSMDFSDVSRALGTEVNGRLGAMALHQLVVTLDYPNGLVHFQLLQ